MKLLLITLTFCITLIINSCNIRSDTSKVNDSKKTEVTEKSKKLLINTVTGTKIGHEPLKKSNAITIVNSDYFEVSLSLMGNDSSYTAGRELVIPTSVANLKYVFFNIVKEDHSDIEFKSSTEFLNFMSERGYEMVDQLKKEYHTEYTFKKK